MSDIVLDEIKSGYNLSKINLNFDILEGTINSELLHTVGGNNRMDQQLDMNSNNIINLPFSEGDPSSILTIGVGDGRYAPMGSGQGALGSAAYKDVTEAPDNNTGDRVLLVGDGGLLGLSVLHNSYEWPRYEAPGGKMSGILAYEIRSPNYTLPGSLNTGGVMLNLMEERANGLGTHQLFFENQQFSMNGPWYRAQNFGSNPDDWSMLLSHRTVDKFVGRIGEYTTNISSPTYGTPLSDTGGGFDRNHENTFLYRTSSSQDRITLAGGSYVARMTGMVITIVNDNPSTLQVDSPYGSGVDTFGMALAGVGDVVSVWIAPFGIATALCVRDRGVYYDPEAPSARWFVSGAIEDHAPVVGAPVIED